MVARLWTSFSPPQCLPVGCTFLTKTWGLSVCVKVVVLPEHAESLPFLVPAAGGGAAELVGGAEDLQVQEGGLVHPQDLFQLGVGNQISKFSQ